MKSINHTKQSNVLVDSINFGMETVDTQEARAKWVEIHWNAKNKYVTMVKSQGAKSDRIWIWIIWIFWYMI